ncbi:MAG TPA: hypothetical protein VI094_11205 [Propionibacteriaceae bacterium]
MSTSDGSTPNAVKREDSTGLSAKKGVMERGLGRDFNITVIAALLSLVVALTTTMITSRIAAGNALKEARRDQEREAIVRLEQALLRETHATFAVVAEGVPAKFPPVGDEFAFDGLKTVSDRVIDYLSARRECDAARTAVEDAQIRAVTKEVSDLNASLAHARSVEEARRYDSQIREVSQKAISSINQALRQM